jgi:hypothetical protein
MIPVIKASSVFKSFVYELTGNEFTPQDHTGTHFEQAHREDVHKLQELFNTKQKQLLQSQAAQTAALPNKNIMQHLRFVFIHFVHIA